MQADEQKSGRRREAQRILAEEITELVHGRKSHLSLLQFSRKQIRYKN
jgi:tyrosyl-tRNA synthetase